MKISGIVCFFIIGIAFHVYGQADSAAVSVDWSLEYAKTVDRADLEKHLLILSSDQYMGRETATSGADKAADYIAAQFKNMGIPEYKPGRGYFQKVPFQKNSWKNISFSINDSTYKHMVDFVALLHQNRNRSTFRISEVLFMGYGIEEEGYSDYKSADVKGKTIMIYKGEPRDAEGRSAVTGELEDSKWSENVENKLMLAQKKGAGLVLIIEDQVKQIVNANRQILLGGGLKIRDGKVSTRPGLTNSFYVSPQMAKTIMGDNYEKIIETRDKIIAKGKTKGKPIALSTNVVVHQEKYSDALTSNNVLGYIEGTDPDLKDEVIIVSAHYDHLGIRGDKIFNGANDNASGTSTVIDIMEAFAKAKKEGNGPRRSVLALLVCGEEKGLLGSYLYTKRPFIPLEKTVVDINVDMVGRTDNQHEATEEYIYIIGSDKLSTELHSINEDVNTSYTSLELDYTYNDEKDPNRYYYRSDHYNFAKEGIPVIFYFNGVHGDYHKSSDTVEKINLVLMEKTARLIFHTAWKIANRDERIRIDSNKK
ncbi:MAG: M28 family peptidase [Bacteroidia bacterium]|nr:M28 family peptidase [Bacteroidia bacterium]